MEPRQMTSEENEWYERETAAFRAWWEAGGEKTYSETPTMAAGAGWLKRAEASSSEIAPSAEAKDALRVAREVNETRNLLLPSATPANLHEALEAGGKIVTEGVRIRDDKSRLQTDLLYEAEHGFYVTKRSAELMRSAAAVLAQTTPQPAQTGASAVFNHAEAAAPSAKKALGPAPRWVTSWPNWHGISGNTEVVPSSDYDALLTAHLELVGQFNGAIKMLQEANEVCRSANSIAQREGKDTEWDSFQYRLRKVLEAQHVALYPSASTDGTAKP